MKTNESQQPVDAGESVSLRKAGMYLLMNDVTEDTMRPIIEWIIEENLKIKKRSHLTLIICSPGGDVNACFAVIDTMKGSTIPVHTVGLGMIASCGLLLFMSGTKGHRILTPNTSILSHQYSWGSSGKEHELFSTVKEFELTSQRIMDHYKKCTGLKEADIRKYLLPESDVWLDAKEAKKLNICDNIKTTY
jgi:ATP-dependent Clp protease protease subunit